MNFKKALFWTVTVSCILAGTGFALNLPSRLLANENDSDDRRITIDPDAGPRSLNTLLETLPDGEPTCCEREWIIRMLHYHPAAVVPRRMYFASCNTDSATPTMFVSLSLGENRVHPEPDPSSGAILETVFDSTTGRFEVRREHRFEECVWMEGITASSDCSTVAALCRRSRGDTDFDFDSLATHANHEWMTQARCAKQEMWLYEWNNGDITSAPEKFVVHRAVDTEWEYGNNYLRLAEDQNTYGIGVKARVFGGGGCHEADAFLVMDRSDHRFTGRGYHWACAFGHTLSNRPVFNPVTGQYALLCGTDGSHTGGPLAGYYFRLEDRPAREFLQTSYQGIQSKGGPGGVLALPDGSYLAVLSGVPGSVRPTNSIPLRPPTSIGIARFSSEGAPMGPVKWVVSMANTYLSYPQLASLGGGRFLLGYGEMKRLNLAADNTDESYRAPWEYWVVEIDANGDKLTQPMRLEGVGWGEQDEMVSLGPGRVGWAYIPNPTLRADNTIPPCNSRALQLSAYVSARP